MPLLMPPPPLKTNQIMNDINDTLKEAYNATSVIVMPGSGSYGMESVARQWATGKKVMVLRNGYFSYRWTDIFEQTGIPSEVIVVKGQPIDNSPQPQFAPHDIDAVVERIKQEKPAVVFAPHPHHSTAAPPSCHYRHDHRGHPPPTKRVWLRLRL